MTAQLGAVSPPADPPLRTDATDLTWNGRPLSQGQVAAAFILGSTLILAAGIALNYVLTDGTWVSLITPVASPFGDGPTYFTDSPYDVTSLIVLVVSLIAMGAGFLAAYQPRLSSPWFILSTGLALLFAAGYVGDRYDLASTGRPLLAITLAAVFGVLSLAWFLGARIGTGSGMHGMRAVGLVVFGFYWSMQAMNLYYAEEGDFVNTVFAGLAVFFFNYFAYQELLSIRRKEDPRALQWLIGAAFLTTGLYVATHKIQPVSEWLIVSVAEQTTWILQLFGQSVLRDGGNPGGSMIYYPEPGAPDSGFFPIQIILACTAIQSIMIFLGGIAALRPPRRGDGVSGRVGHFERLRPTYNQRRTFALLLTVPLIYALNLLRNVVVIGMSADGEPTFFAGNTGATEFICQFSTQPRCGADDAAFWFAHNIIGKGGSLFALIVIAFMVFQILPELYDSLVGLLDLKDRRGPLERWFNQSFGRRGNGGTRTPRPAAATKPVEPPTAALPDRLWGP